MTMPECQHHVPFDTICARCAASPIDPAVAKVSLAALAGAGVMSNLKAPVKTILSWIFSDFGAPGKAGDLPDHVVEAIREVERLLSLLKTLEMIHG